VRNFSAQTRLLIASLACAAIISLRWWAQPSVSVPVTSEDSAVTVLLEQSADAAFHADMGLKVSMSYGDDNAGSYLENTLDSEMQPLFIRFAFHPASLADDTSPNPSGTYWTPKVCLMAGADLAGDETWSIWYRQDTQSMEMYVGPVVNYLGAPEGAVHQFEFDWAIAQQWQVVAVLIEATTIKVYLNDLLVHTEAGAFGSIKTKTWRVGGLRAQWSLVGDVYMDWITLADGQIANPWYYQQVASIKRRRR